MAETLWHVFMSNYCYYYQNYMYMYHLIEHKLMMFSFFFFLLGTIVLIMYSVVVNVIVSKVYCNQAIIMLSS